MNNLSDQPVRQLLLKLLFCGGVALLLLMRLDDFSRLVILLVTSFSVFCVDYRESVTELECGVHVCLVRNCDSF